MEFTAELEATGATTTGFVVPDEVVEALGAGRRPKVVVTRERRVAGMVAGLG